MNKLPFTISKPTHTRNKLLFTNFTSTTTRTRQQENVRFHSYSCLCLLSLNQEFQDLSSSINGEHDEAMFVSFVYFRSSKDDFLKISNHRWKIGHSITDHSLEFHQSVGTESKIKSVNKAGM